MKSPAVFKSLALAVVGAQFALVQADAATLVGVLDLSGRDNAGLGTGEADSDSASPKTFTSTTDLSLDNVAWSDGAYSGVVDISLDATASGAGDQIGRGGKGAFGINVGGTEGGGARATISAGDGTITLSNVQFSYVSGDAVSNIASIEIVAVYIGNFTAVANDAGTINGVTIANGNPGGDLADGRNDLLTYATSAIVDATAGNGLSINGVDLAVTAIPEPSLAGILGLGSLAMMLRRRRRA